MSRVTRHLDVLCAAGVPSEIDTHAGVRIRDVTAAVGVATCVDAIIALIIAVVVVVVITIMIIMTMIKNQIKINAIWQEIGPYT